MTKTLRFRHAWTAEGFLEGAALTVDEDGRILYCRADEEGPRDGDLALPGMPNAHSHCFQRVLAGYGEAARGDDSFWSWREAMYRVAQRLTPEQLQVVAAQAFAEMLQGGFTSVAEFHYLHHRPDGTPGEDMAAAVLAAAKETGIRLVALPVLYQQGGFGREPWPRQRRFVHRDLEAFQRTLEYWRSVPRGVAPHSLRAVAPERLPELVRLTDQVLGPEAPLHVHVSEQRQEVEECVARFGTGPIQLLARHAPDLGPRWNLVHATHATPEELQLLRDRGATVVLCPLTEAYLGDGLFPAAAHAAAGGALAIGSDSDVRIDAASELRWLEYGQRLRDERRARMGDAGGLGAPLWNSLARGGARSLGQPVGVLAPGCFADLVVLDTQEPPLAGLPPARQMDAWLTAGDGRLVRDVYVGGVRVVKDGVATGRPAGSRFARVVQEVMQDD